MSTGAEPSPGPRLRSVPAGASTRATILAAAKRLFDEQGYDATSLRQIADAVGMTKAAVYYHYPAKEHLLVELIRPMLDAMADLVTRLRSDDAVAAGRAALASYLDLFIEHLSVVHLMARDPATQNHPDVGQRIRALVEAVQKHLAGADATTDRVVRAACAISVVHSVGLIPPDLVRSNRDTILAAAVAALEPGGRRRPQ